MFKSLFWSVALISLAYVVQITSADITCDGGYEYSGFNGVNYTSCSKCPHDYYAEWNRDYTGCIRCSYWEAASSGGSVYILRATRSSGTTGEAGCFEEWAKMWNASSLFTWCLTIPTLLIVLSILTKYHPDVGRRVQPEFLQDQKYDGSICMRLLAFPMIIFLLAAVELVFLIDGVYRLDFYFVGIYEWDSADVNPEYNQFLAAWQITLSVLGLTAYFLLITPCMVVPEKVTCAKNSIQNCCDPDSRSAIWVVVGIAAFVVPALLMTMLFVMYYREGYIDGGMHWYDGDDNKLRVLDIDDEKELRRTTWLFMLFSCAFKLVHGIYTVWAFNHQRLEDEREIVREKVVSCGYVLRQREAMTAFLTGAIDSKISGKKNKSSIHQHLTSSPIFDPKSLYLIYSFLLPVRPDKTGQHMQLTYQSADVDEAKGDNIQEKRITMLKDAVNATMKLSFREFTFDEFEQLFHREDVVTVSNWADKWKDSIDGSGMFKNKPWRLKEEEEEEKEKKDDEKDVSTLDEATETDTLATAGKDESGINIIELDDFSGHNKVAPTMMRSLRTYSSRDLWAVEGKRIDDLLDKYRLQKTTKDGKKIFDRGHTLRNLFSKAYSNKPPTRPQQSYPFGRPDVTLVIDDDAGYGLSRDTKRSRRRDSSRYLDISTAETQDDA